MKGSQSLKIGGEPVPAGETRDISLKVSETYTGAPVNLLVRAIRAREDGPVVFLTGAVHGDELNGVGVIRELMIKGINLLKGAVLCIPVVNIFGFENHVRYLPDRRDLNRSFPGNATGSLAFRLAHTILTEIIRKCDYGIDLHAAAVRRTNFPHVRADLSDPETARMAKAFGCELILDGEGPEKSLRAAGKKEKCPTILYEAGEVFKFEPGAIELGVRGVRNVLRKLGMLDGKVVEPAYQAVVQKTLWIRSDVGGILRFHVRPGDLVEKGKEIATVHQLFSQESACVMTPQEGIILGMTMLPAVKPGEPVCHIAIPRRELKEIKKEIKAEPETLHRAVQSQLATSFKVTKPRPPKE